MKDPSDVFLRGVGVTKTGTPSPARIGETITYTYTATIPNGYHGLQRRTVRHDPAAPGVELRSIVGADLDGGALPGSFPAFDTNVTNNPTGRLVSPDTYSNNSGADQKFRVTVTAQVTKAAVQCTGETVLNDVCVTPPSPSTNVSKRNTASFNSNLSLGGTPVPVIEGRKTIDIVQPNPSIIKTVEPERMTAANQELLVTLQVANRVALVRLCTTGWPRTVCRRRLSSWQVQRPCPRASRSPWMRTVACCSPAAPPPRRRHPPIRSTAGPSTGFRSR